MLGVKGLGDSPGDSVKLDTDKVIPRGAKAHEVSRTTPWFKDRSVCRNTQAGDRLVDGPYYRGRGVEGIKRSAFGAIVLLRAKERFELLAQGLPAGVLVATGNRVGKNRESNGPEARKA